MKIRIFGLALGPPVYGSPHILPKVKLSTANSL